MIATVLELSTRVAGGGLIMTSGETSRDAGSAAGGAPPFTPTAGARRSLDDEGGIAASARVALTVPPPPSADPSFAEIVQANVDGLYGYCIRLADGPSDAEDLLQETLIRAMHGYAGLRDRERAKAWLFAIATNCSRDLARARRREVPTAPLDELDDATQSFRLFQTIAIEDPFPYSDELHLDFLRLFRDEDVQAVFGSINPAFRLPLILTVVHGFSCKEAAGILEVPLGTLLSRLHRGRKQLERGLWDYAVANRLVMRADEDEER